MREGGRRRAGEREELTVRSRLWRRGRMVVLLKVICVR